MALGTGQHGVVVGDHHTACLLGADLVGVDGGDAGDQAVGGRVLDQVIELAAAALRGDRQRAVFDERPGIDQLRDVFSRGALVGLAPSLDRCRATGIERVGVARDHLRQIGTDVIEIDGRFLLGVIAIHFGGFDEQDRLALHQRHAIAGCDPGDYPAMGGGDEMLHLHGFDHRDLLTGPNEVAFAHLDRHDGTLQRRRNRLRSGRTGYGALGDRRRCICAGGADGKEQRMRSGLRGANQRGNMAVDEARADAVGDEIGVGQHRLQERNVGLDPADAEFAQRARRLCHDVAPARGRYVDDHLGQQRVERGAGSISRVAEAIDAHTRAGGRVERRQRAAGRLRRACLVHGLHVDAQLHRIAARRGYVGLAQSQRGQRDAGGDRELRFHQIDAEHLFGHGVLDLKPRVGLDEGERRGVAGRFTVNQEFKGAEAVVVRGCRELPGCLDDVLAQAVAQRRARRHLDELLVTPLDRAFALPEMADGAMPVADDLHLDMSRISNQPLNIDAVAAEGRLGLGLAAHIGLLQLRSLLDDAHTASAAAGHGLDHHRAAFAERAEEGFCVRKRGRAGGAVDNRHVAASRQRLGGDLVAEQVERFGRRADKGDVVLGATPCERGIFTQETIARMQCVASGRLRRRDHGLDVEIGPRPTSGNGMRFIRCADMQRQRVVGGMDSDRGDA